MKRRTLVVAICSAVILSAAPAHAQGWRWLEKLSGPGDFTGYELDVKLFCAYESSDGERIVALSTPCLFKKVENRDRAEEGLQGNETMVKGRKVDLTKRVYAIGVALSYLRGRNDLQYEPSSTTVDRTIQLWTIEGFFDRRLRSRMDVGVALGAYMFVVPAADNFTRWAVEPRLTVKLFDLRKGDLFAGTASLRLGVLAFFQEFDATDFGAIPGTYRSGTELGPSVRFVFDFDRNPFSSR